MSAVNIRVAIEGIEEATFLTLDASDTLAILVMKIEPLVRAGTSSWAQGGFVLTDSGRYPPIELLLSQQESSLQTLGLWPGGSVTVSFSSSSEKALEPTPTSDRVKRPLPSDILSSHLNRFESDPILNAQPRFNVQSSSGATLPNGAVTGSTAAVLEQTANTSAKSSKAAEQLRRMLMKQKAVGCRSNLDPSERFYLEFRIPAKAAAPPVVEPTSSAAAASEPLPAPPSASFFLYFPQNWTAGRAMDAARDLILEWKGAPTLVPFVNRAGSSERFYVVSTATRSTPLRQLAPDLEPFDAVDLGSETLMYTQAAGVSQTSDHLEDLKESIEGSSKSSEAEIATASTIGTSLPDAHVMENGSSTEAATPATAPAISTTEHPETSSKSTSAVGAAEPWFVDVQCGKALYHVADLDPLCNTMSDLKARLLRLAFPALGVSKEQRDKDGAVGEKELAAAIAKIKLFHKGKKIDDPPDTQLKSSKIRGGMKLTMVLSKQ